MRTTFLGVLRGVKKADMSATSLASEALEWIFGDEEKVDKLMSCKGEIEAISTECELTFESDDLVAKCLIDIDATAKAQLSKVGISDYLAERDISPPDWKLEKRLVK
jgi:hypothetical protein